jgi:molybdopterin-guanine dinucleotide biosynthesis adapter protein
VALVKPLLLQVVGFKNSGKTTFIHELLRQLTLKGYRAVTIKHHGHGGKPDVVENTDSFCHLSAGAIASLVEGEGKILLQVEHLDWSLEQKIQFMGIFNPDIILIEGHKYEQYPKIVFIRDQEDASKLASLKNIILLLYKERYRGEYVAPCFQRDDSNAIKWVVNYCMDRLKLN